MNQQDMSELNQLVNRYIALWHEPNVELRRQSITELWVEDGAQFTRLREIRGYQALVERVSTAYEKFVKTEGFLFRLSSDVDAHHNAVKFTWEMVPAGGGEAAAVGTIFLLLSDDGRIHLDYQF
jgi:hypothetical protein